MHLWVQMQNLESFYLFKIPLLLLLIVVAVMDFKYRKVKNSIIVFGFFCIFLFAPSERFIENLISAFAFSLFLLFFYYKKYMGAGDVKFFFLLGVIFGFSLDLVYIFIFASLASMLHSLLFVFFRGSYLNIIHPVLNNISLIKKEKIINWMKTIPYAGYMAVSTIFWMLYMPKT